MSNGQKDTIYLDVDDEITSVIDKVRSSPHKIVALVLPKRAAMLASSLNMKLLKRTADDMSKQVVLITSESALLPLAGAAGFYVAKTLQSKPEIPVGPVETETPVSTVEGESPIDPNAPVGQLANLPDDDIKVDDSPDKPAKPDKSAKKSGKSKDSKIKVPNFEKFRLRLILGGLAIIILAVGLVLGLNVLPKAKITLKTDTSNVTSEVIFTADTSAQQFDAKEKILPAASKEFRRTDTERVQSTGQKDKGNKATGSVVLTNCSSATGSLTIPAGTGVSTGELTFITTAPVTLPESSFNGSKQCKTQTKNVSVASEKPGDQYNIASGKTFSVAGYSDVNAENNSPMTGGTRNIVKVVTQADIDKGKQTIQDRANSTASEELQDQLKSDGYYPLKETLVAGEPTITTDHAADEEADSVTVTSTTVNTMLGVKESDLNKLIEDNVKEDIDKNTQVIRDNGLKKANFNIQQNQGGSARIYLQTNAVVGPELDAQDIRKAVAGKNLAETKKIILNRPGIKDVQVDYSPFWVNSTPKNPDKITIIFEDQK